MAEAKTTPGPWTARHDDKGFRLLDRDGCVLSINGGMIPTKADANLIAASPDMYKALEALLRIADAGVDVYDGELLDAVSAGRNALCKARGETGLADCGGQSPHHDKPCVLCPHYCANTGNPGAYCCDAKCGVRCPACPDGLSAFHTARAELTGL